MLTEKRKRQKVPLPKVMHFLFQGRFPCDIMRDYEKQSPMAMSIPERRNLAANRFLRRFSRFPAFPRILADVIIRFLFGLCSVFNISFPKITEKNKDC